jgi:hypothetical protein
MSLLCLLCRSCVSPLSPASLLCLSSVSPVSLLCLRSLCPLNFYCTEWRKKKTHLGRVGLALPFLSTPPLFLVSLCLPCVSPLPPLCLLYPSSYLIFIQEWEKKKKKTHSGRVASQSVSHGRAFQSLANSLAGINFNFNLLLIY